FVALKFLPPTFSLDEEAKQRFIHEAKAASALEHNNICTIYEIGETDDDQLFISMAHYEGETLKQKIEKGPLKTNEAIDIGIQIGEGLAKAHEKNIIHRDIKPANIFITNDRVVKILDFGLAKVSGQTQLTQMGSTVGTVASMSPEQTKGENVDNRADIWSLGVVIYEMLTGTIPFKGDYDQAIIYSILNEEPEPVPEIDERLQHIISKALAKNSDDRYQGAGEIVGELKKIKDSQIKKRVVKKPKLPWIILAASAVVIIAVAIYLFLPSSKNVKEVETIKTIAVLPFIDMSPNKDQEYFSDGISDELINTLSRNPKLRVTARTSSFYFKGTKTNIKTIAQTLNVNHILEGSVRKSGNNLRISADLVNAETDATLWSNSYDGTMSNIFALQDSISGSVAEALNATLLGKGTAPSKQKTNSEAYNLYLLGNHYYALYGKDNFKKAIEYYEQALSIDSAYLPAWAALLNVRLKQHFMGHVPLYQNYVEIREGVEKMLALDPNFADAYVRMGQIKLVYDWDWEGADKCFKKALELEPENSSALNEASFLNRTLGKFEEAINLQKRSIEIDPLNAGSYMGLSLIEWYMDLPDRSTSTLKKCLEINSRYAAAHLQIGLNYLEKGLPDSALTEILRETDPIWRIYGMAIGYYALGRKKEANDKLNEFIKKYQNEWAFQIAEIYAYRNEKDKAFDWLERAYNQRDTGIPYYLKGDRLMRNLVKDPRYAAFMKKINFPM
ncbi:MAG: protein kinase, partial [Ignavibacteriaceae bacterium]|nr:protein kinase [Ignavibacteriaceae bacterium]